MLVLLAIRSGAARAEEPPAAHGVIAVLSGPIPASDAGIRAALADVGIPDATLVAPDDFVGRLRVVSVTAPPDDCEGPVAMDAWRARFKTARDRFQLLDFQASLKDLVALEVELVCLTSPLSASDLVRLELAVAEAHTFLAQAARGDAAKRAFYAGQADAALTRAAKFGAALAAPADVSPDLLARYDAIRALPRPLDEPRVVVAGPGARVGARFNGRPLPDGPFDAVGGADIVQAASGPVVTAAASVPFDPGTHTLVWLDPGGAPVTAGDVVHELVGLARGIDPPDDGELLSAAARVFDDGARVVYVTVAPFAIRVWEPRGSTLAIVPRVDVVKRPSLTTVGSRPWRGALGLAAGGGWSSVGGGDLEGLGGPNAGFAVYGRIRLNAWTALAITVHPDAVAIPLSAEEGGGTLFRASIPARAGVRFGPTAARLAPEAGVDVGVHYFGRFDREEAGFLVVGAAGLSGPVSRGAALRFEGFGGMGLGYGLAGGLLGIEWRP
jgi:hypothetical protein